MNILTFHITMNRQVCRMALVVAILWVLVFLRVKGAFAGIFAPASQH